MSIAFSNSADFYHAHHTWLYQLLTAKLKCHAQAADVAHDAFVQLLSKPVTFDSHIKAKGYLKRVANGICIDQWRRQQVEQAYLSALQTHACHTVISEEAKLLMLTSLIKISDVLYALPEKLCKTFLMAQFDGLTYKQIALQLKVTERSIKNYMAQVLTAIAIAFDDESF